eukprot:CAMPEP_0171099762 /NCGR_PEP_ID=MMETSP0766_2-20121228/52506_1 /TAXON_ID=439317 /ORGANISM="Gambierdiscus australes, Strain CAWD 149" /LENGTH=331 /DNA_ID=CAMNT_0011559465 /DNA_START=44 /DNA_END=1039 /DNA_ORIENTATION=+
MPSADTSADGGSASAGEASEASVLGTVGNRPMQAGLPFVNAEGLAVSQAFQAERGDVMISTYPKTGTTWMQQICHQLRTGGHTDFEEISEEGIVPWLEVGPSLGQDITLPQQAAPRCFKTHQRLSALSHLEAQGARYLCVMRDPTATLLSWFKFEIAHNAPVVASRDINDFLKSNFVIRGGRDEFKPYFGGTLWDFYLEYWLCRKFPNVHVVVYERMRDDLGSQLSKIADFLLIPEPNEEKLKKVLELSSMEWMSANGRLFDDHFIGDRLARLPPRGLGAFKPAAKVGLQVAEQVNTVMNEESRETIARMWREIVTPVTGHPTYEAMVADL